MAKKKRIKIGAMYREYGEMEGALCRDCCNFITITADGKRHCKCRAYGKYEACGLYNTPVDKKYKPIFEGGNE